MDYITWKAFFTVLGALIGVAGLVARDKAWEKREGGEEQVVGKPIVTEMMTWEKPA